MHDTPDAERSLHAQYLGPDELDQGRQDIDRYLAGDTAGWHRYEDLRPGLLDRVTAAARRTLTHWRRAV